MKIRYGIVALAVFLAGCAQPVVTPRGVALQEKVRTGEQWHQLAATTADRIVDRLRRIPDATGNAHILDAKAPAPTMAARPLYVRQLDNDMPFSKAFHEMLVLQLMVRGEEVATAPAGATIVNYDVQVLPYNHREAIYAPGSFTVMTAMAVGVSKALEASTAGGMVAAGAAADVVATAVKVLGDQPNTEVVVTTDVVDYQKILFKNIDVFYIEDDDARLYAASFDAPPARPMVTGPTIPYPTPTRTVRVAAQ